MQKSTSLLIANFLQFIGVSIYIGLFYMLTNLPAYVELYNYAIIIAIGIIMMSVGIIVETKNNETRAMPIKKMILIHIMFMTLIIIADNIVEDGFRSFLFSFSWDKILLIFFVFSVYLLWHEKTIKEIILYWVLISMALVTIIIPSFYYPKTLIIDETKLTDNEWQYLDEYLSNDSTNLTIPDNSNSPCEKAGWKWSEEFKECLGIDAATCENIGGKFNECASACRNDPKAEICTMQCVQLCDVK